MLACNVSCWTAVGEGRSVSGPIVSIVSAYYEYVHVTRPAWSRATWVVVWYGISVFVRCSLLLVVSDLFFGALHDCGRP